MHIDFWFVCASVSLLLSEWMWGAMSKNNNKPLFLATNKKQQQKMWISSKRTRKQSINKMDRTTAAKLLFIHNMNITCSVLCIHNRVLVDTKTTKKVVISVPYLGLSHRIHLCVLRFFFIRISLSFYFSLLQKSDRLDPSCSQTRRHKQTQCLHTFVYVCVRSVDIW